ncbi:hypothetical protein Fcan01_25951 [Folsomia candida]|uniref:Uncharacterized protein n=1 Tax=Folsomia candida TaxID=158441 RepID=A0A226D445_FOLCA|nr:hypothetical protein Fcan01_25951 [Folsomia candida]
MLIAKIFALANGNRCFAAFGQIQAFMKRLNLTFSVTGRSLTSFGVLCIVTIVALSSSYDAIITTDIIAPPEKYVVTNIHELLTKFGYKLYSGSDIVKNWTRFKLSNRKDFAHRDNPNVYIWDRKLSVSANFYGTIANSADQIGFLVAAPHLTGMLYHLNRNSVNVTCNILKRELFNWNIFWDFKYFGSEGLYRTLQGMSSIGLYQLYVRLWKFTTDRGVRNQTALMPKDNLGLENLLVGFQLYFLFGLVAVLSFFHEIISHKFNIDRKITFTLLKLKHQFYKVGGMSCTVLFKLQNMCHGAIMKFRKLINMLNYMFHDYLQC